MSENGVQIPIKPIPQNVGTETIEAKEDKVNLPNHYHQGGIDVIKYMELKFSREQLIGFHRGNVLKYVTRYREKGGMEDLRKAEFYLKKLIVLEADSDGT